MAKSKELRCSCGELFGEDGICPACGKQRPRSAGYRVWHSFWCVIAALILLLCITTTCAVRYYLRSDKLSSGLRQSRLSDASVPFAGTVSSIIRSSFVTDEQITGDDVAGAVDSLELPQYLAGKLSDYGDLLRGDADKAVTVEPDEIVTLLDGKRQTIYQQCMLVIEDSDMTQLHDSLDAPLGFFSGLAKFLYGSKAGRMLARFRLSVARILIDIALMGLLLWRWIRVRANSGRDKSGAVRGMGRTVLIPSAITFVLVLIGAVRGFFVKDGVVGLYAFTSAARTPYWLISVLGVAAGLFLLMLGRYLAVRASRPKPVKAAPAAPAVPQTVTRSAAPAQDHTPKKFCTSCGKELAANARFCIYCGADQSADRAEDVSAETAAPKVSLDKADAPAADAADTGSTDITE